MVVPVSAERRTTTLAVENPVCATRLSTSRLATPWSRRMAVTRSRSLQKLSTSLWTRLVRTSSSSTTEWLLPIKCRAVSSSRFMPNIPETSSARTFCCTSLLVTCSTSHTVRQFLPFITATKSAKPNKTSKHCYRESKSPVTSCYWCRCSAARSLGWNYLECCSSPTSPYPPTVSSISTWLLLLGSGRSTVSTWMCYHRHLRYRQD